MKTAKKLITIVICLVVSSANLYPAVSDSNALLIPKELDKTFRILTRAALYIAEHVNIDLIDCESISLCCGDFNISPRTAFMQRALTALYNKASRQEYPIIKLLLLEVGHTAAAEQDATVESQIKRCIQHISYMQELINILPNTLPRTTIMYYKCLHLAYAPNTLKNRKFIITSFFNKDIHYGSKVRTTLKTFPQGEQAKDALDVAKKLLQDYLDNPEDCAKRLREIKAEKAFAQPFF